MSEHQESRLAKLQKIEEMGIDPWGQSFPGRQWNSAVRERREEVKYQLEDGSIIALPKFDDMDPEERNYRSWKEAAGKGEETGPQVRVAGRIILLRGQGKIKFITLRDWTGDIQIMIGKAQVGEEPFELTKTLRLG